MTTKNGFAHSGIELNESRCVIVEQPHTRFARIQVKAPTQNWRTTHIGEIIPVKGLDYLTGVSSVLIQQTTDLEDPMLSSRERRYTVRVPDGQDLYYGSEFSTITQRCCCGSGRGFVLSLHDANRQESMQMQSRTAASSCCIPCRLQKMKIITPPGDFIGCIEQKWRFITPYFWVMGASGEVLYQIIGPSRIIKTNMVGEQFKILSGDSTREVGSLCHSWDRQNNIFVTALQFPKTEVDAKHKALLIGAAFLMEYTYFCSASFCRKTC